MLEIFPERGGDPDRAGQEGPARLRRLARPSAPGEPALGQPARARPARAGTSSARRSRCEHLGGAFDVQGGGSDLVFPHHEMCAGQAQVADPARRSRRSTRTPGWSAYDGEKMSKSQGNLVFVSALRNSDVDPMAIRLALLRHHYRSDWEWTDAELWDAVDTLGRWRRALALGAGAPAGAGRRPRCSPRWPTTSTRPRAVAAVEAWVDATLGTDGLGRHQRRRRRAARSTRCSTPRSGWRSDASRSVLRRLGVDAARLVAPRLAPTRRRLSPRRCAA